MRVGIVGVVGRQGSGKTAMATYWAVGEHIVNKRKIIATYTIKGKNVRGLYLSFGDIVDMLYSQSLPNTIINQAGEEISFKEHYRKALGKVPKSVDDVFNQAVIVLDEAHIGADSYDFLGKGARKLGEFITQVRKREILMFVVTQVLRQVARRIRDHIQYVVAMDKVATYDSLFICKVYDGLAHDTLVNSKMYDLIDIFNFYDTKEIVHYRNIKRVGKSTD